MREYLVSILKLSYNEFKKFIKFDEANESESGVYFDEHQIHLSIIQNKPYLNSFILENQKIKYLEILR